MADQRMMMTSKTHPRISHAKCLFLTLLLCCVFFSTHDARAQEPQQPQEPAKIEVGVQFSSLNTGQKVYPELLAVDLPTSDAGFGGRFGFNFNRHVRSEERRVGKECRAGGWT